MAVATNGSDAVTQARQIPARRISFEESLQRIDRYFADGDVLMSHVVVAFSSVFPEGEDFFVRSVRNYRDVVEDPELRRQVAGFIGQEALHGREHRALNHRFTELGYGADFADRLTGRMLRFREKVVPKIGNLAATAALEHYTATFAEVLLRDPEARAAIGGDEVCDLLLWHAIEECEHKAVAFDVYKVAGGTERTRRFTMNLITVGFILGMAAQSLVSAGLDPNFYRDGNFRRSMRTLRRSPWLKREVWERLRDYNREDFHPDDHDTEELLEEWRNRLFGDGGALVDKLATAA